jgi:hypothetical protein
LLFLSLILSENYPKATMNSAFSIDTLKDEIYIFGGREVSSEFLNNDFWKLEILDIDIYIPCKKDGDMESSDYGFFLLCDSIIILCSRLLR